MRQTQGVMCMQMQRGGAHRQRKTKRHVQTDAGVQTDARTQRFRGREMHRHTNAE